MYLSLIIYFFILAVSLAAFGKDENLVPYTLGGTTIMVDPDSIGLNSPLMSHLLQGMPSRTGLHGEKSSLESSGYLNDNIQGTKENINSNYVHPSSHEEEIDSSNYDINIKDSTMKSPDNNENKKSTYNSNHNTYDNERSEEHMDSNSSQLSHTNYGSDFIKTSDGKLSISINSPSPIIMEDAGGIYLQDEHLQHTEDQSTNQDLYYSANVPSIKQVSQQIHRIVSDLNKQSTIDYPNDKAPTENSPHRSPPIPNAEPLDPGMFILDPRPLQPAMRPPLLENMDGFAGVIYDPDEISTFDSAFIDEPESTTIWDTDGIINGLLIDDFIASKEQDILKDEQEFQENLRIQEEAQQDLNEAMGTILGSLFRKSEVEKNNGISESSKDDEQQMNVNKYYFDDQNDSDNHGNESVPEIYDEADIPAIFRNKDILEEHFASLEDNEKPVFILPSNVKSESDLTGVKFISDPSLLNNFPPSREDPNSRVHLKDSDRHTSSSVLYYSNSPSYPISPIKASEASGVYINGEKVYNRHVGADTSSLHSWFNEDPITIFDPNYNGSSFNSNSTLHPTLGPSFFDPSRPEDNNIQHGGRPSIPGHQTTAKPGKPIFLSTRNATECVSNCRRIRLPVCGSDGQTYNNLCMLELASCEGYDVTLAYDGNCKETNDSSASDSTTCPSGCQRDFNPVCGSDGKTYNNKCMLEEAACEGVEVTLVNEGKCETKDSSASDSTTCPRGCTRDFNPVCGSDGKTYNNKCLLKVAACDGVPVTMLYKGKCDNISVTTTSPGDEVIAETTEFEGAIFHRATETLTSKRTCRCGLRFNNKIVNGEPTTIESFPWQVGITLTRANFTYCAGSIINDRFVLTAAHCVQGREPEDVHIRFAETSRHGKADIEFVKKFHSKKYTRISHHDIALIELMNPISFSAGKMPICLPPQGTEELTGEEGIVTGWGRLKWNGELADELHQVKVVVLSNRACENKTSYKPQQVHKKIICAAERKKDACQGDSGGPLVRQIDDHYEQMGIVSWGIKCAKKRYPGIYTKVSAYRNWIDDIAQSGIGCRDLKNNNSKKEKMKDKKKPDKNKESNKNRKKPNKNKRKKNKNKNKKDNKVSVLSAIPYFTLKDTVSKVRGDSKCKSNCQRERIPVCGSNGKTYNNLCMLELEECEGVDVSLAHQGECEITSSEEINQNEEIISDNNTKKKKKSNKKRKQQIKINEESSLTSTEEVQDDIDWSNLKQAIKAIAASVDS